MSDFNQPDSPARHEPPRGPDRMRDTLTALRTDVQRIGLADAGDVRRRGQARTRHQVLAGVAAVVVVAGAVAGSFTLAGDRKAEPLPGSSSSPTAAAAGIDRSELLTVADLPQASEGFPHYEVADESASVDDAAESSCLTGLKVPDATAHRAVTFTAVTGGTYQQTSVNAVYRLKSAPAAQEAEQKVLDYLAGCPTRLGDSTSVDRSALGEGTVFLHAPMSKPDITDAVPQEALMVVRHDDTVSVATYMEIAQDTFYPQMLQPIIEAMGQHIGLTPPTSSSPVLLGPDDLPRTGSDHAWELEPPADAGLYATDTCLPGYDGAAFERTDSARFTAPKSEISQQAAVQWVYVTQDEAGAASTYKDAKAWIGDCAKRSHPELNGPVTLNEELVGSTGAEKQAYLQMTVGDVHQRIGIGQVGRVVTVVVMQRTSTEQSDESQLEFTLAKALTLLKPYATS